MANGWELFDKAIAGRVSWRMRVSINERGGFSINKKAFDELGKPQAVQLLFDKDTRRIGMRPCELSAPSAYQVKKQGESQSYLVRSAAFINHYGLKIVGTEVFADPRMENGMLILDLNSTRKVESRQPSSSTTRNEADKMANSAGGAYPQTGIAAAVPVTAAAAVPAVDDADVSPQMVASQEDGDGAAAVTDNVRTPNLGF